MISADDMRAIALGLPGSDEQATYGGAPSWRTEPRMFTWIRDDPEALLVWVALVGPARTPPGWDGPGAGAWETADTSATTIVGALQRRGVTVRDCPTHDLPGADLP